MTADLFEMSAQPPRATLIAGPVGSGKTHAAIEEILLERSVSGSAFKPVWVLTATGEQAHGFRARLVTASAYQVLFGVEFFTFESLYLRLLDLLGDPQRQLAEAARYRVLRHVIAELDAAGALAHFGPVAKRPGFVGQVAGLIYELKQGLIDPVDFADVAAQRGPKDRDLARIYTAYQDFLRARALVDRHGAGWLAVEHLEKLKTNDAPLPVEVTLLVVDGFDQFNKVHIELLVWLSRLVPNLVLTLTRPATEPGRRFQRFDLTHAELLKAGGQDVQYDKIQWDERAPADLSLDPVPARAPVLDHLVAQVFRPQPERLSDPGAALALIEAPDIPREVSAVLRRVKRLLLAGVSPEDVLIVARDLARYAGALRETARAYGLPLVVRRPVPLRENPAVAALLDLIDLAAGDFPRRETLDTLRSPYFAPPHLLPEGIALLARASLDHRVTRGRGAWLDAARWAAYQRPDEDGDPGAARLDSDAAAALAARLAAWFDRVTPPAQGTVYEFVDWLEALIGPDPAAQEQDDADASVAGEPVVASEQEPEPNPARAHLDLPGCIRAGRDPERVARDIEALHALKRVWAGARHAADLVAGDGPPPVMDWAEFRQDLGLALDEATVLPLGGQSRLGRVLATDALEARGLPHDHVFLLGLAEGVFPAPQSDGALYHDQERRALEQGHGLDMITGAERADDMSLFYQVLGLARRTLTLSRFTVDDRGAPVPPSPYWSAVCAAVEPGAVERIGPGAAPQLAGAAAPGELAVALAAALGTDQTDAALAAHNALLARNGWGTRWRAVLRGRALEAGRLDPRQSFDRFSGILRDPAWIAAVADALGPERVWSASQLTDLGQCPFRFFARRLLGLEEFAEPEEGPDVMQIGAINHAILEDTYRRVGAAGLAITPENADRALAILDDVAEEIFDRAPEDFGFRPSALWRHERADLLRRLRALVALDFSEETPLRLQPNWKRPSHPVLVALGEAARYPLAQEARFGMAGGSPLVVIEGEAGPLLVRGLIDRLDRAGDVVVVIDYKTGSTRRSVSDLAEGRDFQMLVYLLAAPDVLQDDSLRVGGGLFWHIHNRETSSEIAADDPALDAARQHAHAAIRAARAGQYPVQPNGGRCPRYCPFGALCRYGREYRDKPRPAAGG